MLNLADFILLHTLRAAAFADWPVEECICDRVFMDRFRFWQATDLDPSYLPLQ